MHKRSVSAKSMTRRQFIQHGALTAAGLLLFSCADEDSATAPFAATEMQEIPAPIAETPAMEAPTLARTPQCDDDDETPAQTEGPFYTPETPQRTSFLEDGATAAPFVLSGRVLGTNCEPIADAIVDFWHVDDAGQYDNNGFRYRGHQFTDEQGCYQLQTILPGLYPGRTRHLHVKVQGQQTPLLTTQLYFPGEPGNANDSIFDQELLVTYLQEDNIGAATFDFVLERSA